MNNKYILFLSLIFCVQIVNAQYWWETNEVNSMPERVSNNAVCEGFVGDTAYVYSFGGIDSTKTPAGIHLRSFRYNTVSDIWDTIAPLPDTMGKIAAGASRIGDIIYIIGGYHVFSNFSEKSSNKVHRYDVNTNQYLSDASQLPIATDDHVQCVWRDSLIYVITGWSNTGNIPNVQIYNPSNDTWAQATEVPDNHIYKSFGASGSIAGDTIYYFGGARSSGSFSIQNYLRKGVIDSNNPTNILWSDEIPNPAIKGYRMAATAIGESVFWLGGSAKTYNFDGLAYSNGQGVEPNQGIIELIHIANYFDVVDGYEDLQMDLRGIANISDSVKYITGGMESNQWVSDKTIRLVATPITVDINNSKAHFDIKISPNPVDKKLFIDLKNISSQTTFIIIFDNNGIEVSRINNINNHLEIKTSKMPSGLYFIQINTLEESITKKFVVQH